MKKGFTLLELIVVIIIIGVLATLGFGQYTQMVEKGRTAEARTVLGQLRTADAARWHETGGYATALSQLPVSAPTACVNTHYFNYAINAGSGTATRCSTAQAGKAPGATTTYTIALTTNTGSWSCTAGFC